MHHFVFVLKQPDWMFSFVMRVSVNVQGQGSLWQIILTTSHVVLGAKSVIPCFYCWKNTAVMDVNLDYYTVCLRFGHTLYI